MGQFKRQYNIAQKLTHMKLVYGVTFLFLISCLSSFGQGRQKVNLTGVIVNESKAPMFYATVSVHKNQDSTLVGGTVTDEEGAFQLQVVPGHYYLNISHIGYQSKQFSVGEVYNHKTVGTISLALNQNMLKTANIVGERSEMSFKLDKRVFNVGKDLSSAGTSSLEVLNNIPSVEVSMEGGISLRGNSNVKILINGNPTAMTSGGNSNALGSITADMIERVEVITNPSAKYDAEGTVGIINIILKKENKKGTNGSVTLNTGIPNNHSIGFSLNHRKEKFNLFTQIGVGRRTFPSNFNGRTTNHRLNRTFYSDGDAEKHETFYNFILGTDYNINKYNVLTLSGHFGFEQEEEESKTKYDIAEGSLAKEANSIRNESTEAGNPKAEYKLEYKKTFKDNKDRSLTANISGFYFGKEKKSDFTNNALTNSQADFTQKVKNDFSELTTLGRIDYVHPFKNDLELETGAKYELSNLKSDYVVDNLTNGTLVRDANLTNKFDFDQGVSAAYASLGKEWGNFGLKLGVRTEFTQIKSHLYTTNTSNDQEYLDLFPSGHASYKFTETASVQLGYSRRISRPSMWDLSPFVSIRDNLNRSSGNPKLKPEYTDAFELNIIQRWDKVSFSGTVYNHLTNGVMEDIITVTDSLTNRSPLNVGKSNNLGIELTGKVDVTKKLRFLIDWNGKYFQRDGQYENTSFNFSNTSWRTRGTIKYKVSKQMDVELRGRFRSEEQQLLSTLKSRWVVDFGMKYKFLKGRLVAHLSARNIFNEGRRIIETNQPDFYQYNDRQWRVRSFTFGVSWSFGKGEAMEFSGQKMF